MPHNHDDQIRQAMAENPAPRAEPEDSDRLRDAAPWTYWAQLIGWAVAIAATGVLIALLPIHNQWVPWVQFSCWAVALTATGLLAVMLLREDKTPWPFRRQRDDRPAPRDWNWFIDALLVAAIGVVLLVGTIYVITAR